MSGGGPPSYHPLRVTRPPARGQAGGRGGWPDNPRMHLTPRERERLLLAAAADLARRRLARGARLGATEAIALVCDEACEMAWDGTALEDVIERARQVIAPQSLLPGLAGLVPVIEVEALFPWGTTLVHIDAPFGPSPSSSPERPGAVRAVSGDIELAAGAQRRSARLRNTGPRDVWISSHFPLGQVNPAVEVAAADAPGHRGDRASLRGDWHLDLPAGEALLLRAGEEREATVVASGRTAGSAAGGSATGGSAAGGSAAGGSAAGGSA
jgi:urease subunit gamma/beta